MSLIPTFRPSLGPPHIHVETGSIVRWRPVALLMLLSGAAIVEVGMQTGWVTTSDPLLGHASAAGFLLLAAWVLRVRVDSYRLFARVTIFSTILLITALGAAFDGIATVPVYYVWPLLAAAYLLSRREVAAFSLLAMAGCAAGNTNPDLGTADYISVLLVSAVVIIAVRILAENLGRTIGSLRSTSFTDPLTGLLNRRSLYYRFAQAYVRAVAGGEPLSTLVLDIDHFKHINDRCGHAVGDQALVRFSELLVGACRSTDYIARMGGEEFAVVMPGTTADQARERAEAFATILREDRGVGEIRMTTSGGVATLDTASDGWEALLTAADDAVYDAKRSGRDRIVVAASRRAQPLHHAHD